MVLGLFHVNQCGLIAGSCCFSKPGEYDAKPI